MSLDKNLFTLVFTPHKDNPNVVDLVDPSETIHYRKQRIPGAEYKIEVYDPSSESLLATVSAPSASSKAKNIELYNPTCVIELKSTGTMSFRWGFKWEEHEFEWKKEECFIIRKPDPPVNIAVTREQGPRGLKTTSVQLLDYNLNRFDINDRKGLEIVMLTALLTFSDTDGQAVAAASPIETTPIVSNSNHPLTRASSALASATSPSSPMGNFGFGRGGPPPPPPPKPAPKTGIDRIAEMQAMQGEYNEILVGEEGGVVDYASYCNKLLEDDALLFISVKSAEAEQVPKVLQVVEETKRTRHKAGLDQDEELRQYVLYDQKDQKKGPKIINLDDDKKNKYAPPKSLIVHLSKIDMPELQPKPTSDDKNGTSFKKEDRKASKQPRPAPSTPIPGPSTSGPVTPQSTEPKPSRFSTFFKSSSHSTPSKPNKIVRPQSAGNTPEPPPVAPQILAVKPDYRPPQVPATKPDYRPPQAPATKPDYRPPQVSATKPDYRPPQAPATKPDYRPPPQHSPSHHYPSTKPSHHNGPPSGRPPSHYGPPVSTGAGAGPAPGLAFPQPWSPGPMPPPPPHHPQSSYGSYSPYPNGGGYGGGSWTPNSNYTPGPPPPPPPSFPAPGNTMPGGYPGDTGAPKPSNNLATITQGATTVAHGLMGLMGRK